MNDLPNLSPTETLARTIWGEARGEIDEGKQAIACVVLNRIIHGGWWGDDVKSVCLKPFQFSCWLKSDPNRPKLMAITSDDPIYVQCLDIAALAIVGNLHDVTLGSDSYLRTGTNASWARNLTPVKIIGNHSFYKIIK